MTKELESEVPIRCTLFVDVSQSVRLGTLGHTALARLMEIAAAVAQANGASRDLTGVCIFDEAGVHRLLRPARGTRHALMLTHALSDAAGLLPDARGVPLAALLPLTYGAIQDFHPNLLDQQINAMPVWLPYWVGLRWLWWTWAWPFFLVRRWRREGSLWRLLTRGLRDMLLWQRTYRWRKQAATVLALHYELGPGGLGLLMEGDDACADYCKRFLAEHQIACPAALYDAQGRYQYASAGKVVVLANALLASVLHARDNELFVLLVDLLELGPALDKLLPTVKIALARHHQVLVLCPWPPGVELPPRRQSPPRAPSLRTELGGAPSSSPTRAAAALPTLQEVLARADTLRLHQAYHHARLAFGRLGVPMLTAAHDSAVDLILRRIQELRVRQRGVP